MNLSPARRAIETARADHPGGPILVSIDGHSASGKSTVADVLASDFDAAVVAGDDFYCVMDELERTSLTPTEGADRYYDWERMDLEALDPLAAGLPAVFRPYDWSTGRLSHESKEIQPAQVVIVEGLFVSRPELRYRYAVSMLVTADARQRWQRQLARGDATPDWLQRWDHAERHHLAMVSPPSCFDLVIDCSE